MTVTLSSRLARVAKYSLLGAASLPPVAGLGWYLALASEQQRKCTEDILHSLPNVVDGGVGSFSGSLVTGLIYVYSLWGLDDTKAELLLFAGLCWFSTHLTQQRPPLY